MSGRVFDGRIARGIAPDDRARQERLKATARALVTAVRDGLVRDGVVRLHGFGTFRLRPVAARRGRNPRTGEPIDIPAGWRVMFRPAKALRERVEPDRAPALPIGEPHASREAMLAASASDAARITRCGAGRIPAEGIAAPPMEPERAAAAAMSEPKFSVQGPVPPGSADLEADSRVTRSPAALTRAPAANEPSPTEPRASVASATEPKAAPETGRRRDGHRYALLLLLVLLLAGLAWLFRPVDSPVPTVAEEPGPSAPREAAGDAGIVSEEPETATAGMAPTGGQTGTDDDTTTADEKADASSAATADRDVAASPDDTNAADAPTPSTGAAASSGDEVMAALSRAAEATGVTPSETSNASTEAATAGDADGEAAADAGAVPDKGSADDTASAGTEPVQTGRKATGSAADAPDRSQAADDAVAGMGVTGEAAADEAPWFSGRDYTVRSGDTLWDLADRHYVNPYYWPHIWNHNAGIANPDRLEVRQGLWLPGLEGDPRTLTEADRRSIAEGYLRLYRFFREQGDANPQYALVGVRYFDASVLPERLRGTAAGRPGDTLAAAFQARLEAEFPLD